jgi:hypothetical protein
LVVPSAKPDDIEHVLQVVAIAVMSIHPALAITADLARAND